MAPAGQVAGQPSQLRRLDELDWAAQVFVADLPVAVRRLRRPAGGYRYAVVAGAVVQAGGELTGARPGTVLRPGS